MLNYPIPKEIKSNCHKLKFSNPYTSATGCCKPFDISNLDYLIKHNS